MMPILFGYPTPDSFGAADRGEIALGGCVVMGEDPTHRCASCGEDVMLDFDGPLACASCGRPLGNDLEDEPDGDAGLPICGDCNRECNFAAIEEVDLLEEAEGLGGWDDN